MLQCATCGRQFDADATVCPEDGTPLSADPTVAAETPSDPLAGRTLDDKYRLDERLGEGGMGTVYRATHLLIGRPVAVKVLHSRLVADEAARERFRREALAAGRLRHSNTVAVTDYGETADGLVYLVMELLEGHSLRDLLAREAPLEPARAVSIMLQVAAAVAAAHESGVIHRDLKPGNIFMVQRPNAPYLVKVLDFGIAKLADEGADGASSNTLTGTGVMIGTPRYMSPEQCDGAPLTPASDVYSLGVLLYEMLTGQTPFTGPTPLSLALKHSSEAPRPPRELVPNLPPQLEAVVLHALEKDPLARPGDAGEFRRELYEVAERLGLEHSAGFSAPTVETLRDAGSETPSGRFVIDIERLRRNRAAHSETREMTASTTDERDAANTSGNPLSHVSRSAAGERSVAAVSSGSVSSDSPASAESIERRARAREEHPLLAHLPAGRGGRKLLSKLTEPPMLVALICAALLVVFGTILWLRPPATGDAASAGDEARVEDEADAVGRALNDEEPAAAPGQKPAGEPRTAAEFYESGTYKFSVRDYDGAVRDFRRAVELQPDFPTAHNRLGRALLMKGQFDAAVEEFRAAVEQRGGRYPVAQYNLGFALQQQGKTDEAVAAYRGAIDASDGKYPDAHYQIGEILSGQPNRGREAAEAFRRAIEQNDGRDPEAFFKLGITLARMDDFAGSEAAFQKAIEQRGGDFPYAHYNLALVYERTNRLPEAIRHYETYLQQAPRDRNRRAAENSIRELRRRAEREGNSRQ